MTLKAWRFGLAASVAIVLGLLSIAGWSVPWAQGQPDCTVTVKSGASIQEAIDGAKEGAVICLAAGTWQEHLTISKSLALRGAGREQTKIKGKEEYKPVIGIASDAEITVSIEGLTVAEAKDASGIVMRGSAQATITNSQLSGNGWYGIEMWGSAQAEIKGSTIEGNGTSEDCKKKSICNGIRVESKSQVKIIGSKIIKNADWGVGAGLKQCGYPEDGFTGQVVFEDMKLEQIAGNNTSGNQTGMGNPGNHPWNRPDVPDGQACLP